MTNNRIACLALALAGLVFASYAALAGDAISHPAEKPVGSSANEMVPSLAVINSDGATLQGNKLTLKGVTKNSIVFADRPVRAAGHVLTSDFIKEWDEGVESFAKDPPNATISVLSEDGKTVEDAVVVLKSPKLSGDELTFEVSVLEGGLANATGPASLFVDWFAVRGVGGRAVVGGRPAWHGAWYAHPGAAFGAGVAVGAVGAAVAHPYAYPYYGGPCGYYPYPPCY